MTILYQKNNEMTIISTVKRKGLGVSSLEAFLPPINPKSSISVTVLQKGSLPFLVFRSLCPFGCRVYTIDRPQQTFGADPEWPKVKIKYKKTGNWTKKLIV
jgi:hypothetical protein